MIDSVHAKMELAESNLFRLFLCGFFLHLNFRCDKAKRNEVMTAFNKHAFPPTKMKEMRFARLALRGLKMKIDLSPEDTLELLMDFIREVGLEDMVPNGGDLVDVVGEFLSSIEWSGMLEQLPGFAACIELLKNSCEGNISAGLFNKDGCLRMSFKTEGLKSFYELVMMGMY